MRDPKEYLGQDPTQDDNRSNDLHAANDDFPFPEDMGETNRLSGIGATIGAIIGFIVSCLIYFTASDETIALFTFAKWHLFFTGTGLGAAAGGMLSMAVNSKRFKDVATGILRMITNPKRLKGAASGGTLKGL